MKSDKEIHAVLFRKFVSGFDEFVAVAGLKAFALDESKPIEFRNIAIKMLRSWKNLDGLKLYFEEEA